MSERTFYDRLIWKFIHAVHSDYEYSKGHCDIRTIEQFNQAVYNRLKEILPKKLEMPDIELLRNNRYYKLHQTRNEAITECLESIRKELNCADRNL